MKRRARRVLRNSFTTTMTSVRKAMLQDKVFAPQGERLVHVMQVRTSEENEEHCLCITVTKDEEVMIVYLKVPTNGLREKCQKEEIWYLEDLVLVDGRDATKDNPHLDMHFQTLCTWEASSTAAKYAFVRSLKKTNKLYFQRDIQFVNFDHAYIQETSFFGVPEDTILVIQLCIQAFNCICLLGSL